MKELIKQKITNIRKKYKLTRKELEAISGFKERNISAYERGEVNPSIDYINFISLYFGYTKESILSDSSELAPLDKAVRILLMYQSIFNYDDEKMADLLGLLGGCDKETAIGVLYSNYLNENNALSIKVPAVTLRIAKNLNIKFSLLSDYSLADLADSYADSVKRRHISHKAFYELIERDFKVKDEIKELENNGLDITPDYYASIIKKRNNPETITPLSTLADIPEKHKELLALLPVAPDSFVDEIIKKLKAMQDLQRI